MSLFTAALGGAGEAVQGMAQGYIKEEIAANLAQVQAELDQQKAKTLADLQARNQRARDDYLVSPEYTTRAAASTGAIKLAEDNATTRSTSPGQTLVRNGKETYANPNETAAELNYSLYEQGLRAGGGGARATGTGGAGSKGGAGSDDEKARQTRLKVATDAIKNTTIGDALGQNPKALALFQDMVVNNPELAPATAAQEAIDAANSADPEYVKKNPKAARQTETLVFDDAGKPWIEPRVTGNKERSRGKGERKPASEVQVVEFIQNVLAPQAANRAPPPKGQPDPFAEQVKMALRAAKMGPEQFERLVELAMEGDPSSPENVELGRLKQAGSNMGRRPSPVDLQGGRMGAAQQPAGTVINPLTGQPATLAQRRP